MKFSKIVAIFPAIALGAAWAQDGWKRPDAVSATIRERFASGQTHEVTVVSCQSYLAVTTRRGLNGALEGVPRVEAITPSGIYTWLEGKPHVALQLLIPSSLDYLEYLARPRFSRADLEFNLAGIEKALQKRTLVGKSQQIAGRDCLVLIVLDRPDSMNVDYQKLWIDKQTGLTMRLEDYFRGEITYEREVKALTLGSEPPDAQMAIKEGALIIRGAVSADTLLRVPTPRSKEDYRADIEKIRNTSKAPDRAWLRAAIPDDPFGYAQTTYREIYAPAITMPGSNQPQPRQNPQRGNQFVNAADMMRMAQRFYEQGGSATLQITAAPGGGQQVQVQTEIGGERREFVVIREPDGSVTVQQQGGDQTSQQTGQTSRQEPKNKTYYVAKSDFVDPKTGNTLTLVQCHGAPAEPYLGPFVLMSATKVADSRLSNAISYTVPLPVAMTVLTWQVGEVRYALASTNLSVQQLRDFAAKVK